MKTTVLKFGGSSLADSSQFRKVAAIIRSHEETNYVVASAPGKRSKDDTKVTDMLYSCYNLATSGNDFVAQLNAIKARFSSIASELGVSFDVDGEFNVICSHLEDAPEEDYMASRGEYLNSKLLASYLGYDFIDAAGNVQLNKTYVNE